MRETSPVLTTCPVQTTQELGLLVRAQRRSQHLRIDDAASLLGVSVDLLSRLENGASGVRLDKLLTVLDGLGLCLQVGPKGAPRREAR
jgi:transcriptional regulator with XRE-family HTH domain